MTPIPETTADTLRELVRRAGSVEAFARSFRYCARPSRASLYNWLNGRPIPPSAAKAIQRRAKAAQANDVVRQ